MKRLIQTHDGTLYNTDSYDTAKQHEDELFDKWLTGVFDGTTDTTLKDVVRFITSQSETDDEFYGSELGMLKHILRAYWENQ